MKIKRFSYLRSVIPDVIKLENGITLKKIGFGFIARFLRNFKRFRDKQDKFVSYDIELSGKSVGYIMINEDSKEEINFVMLHINPEFRGNHYATETLKSLLRWSKKLGYKTVTLEVPGSSPDARHIYEKLGFVAVKDEESNLWDGLTYMKKNL